MLSKNEIKYIQSLCHKKQREAEGLFIAEGSKLIDELLKSQYRFRKIYALAGWVAQYSVPVEVIIITEIELQKISGWQTPNGVLAVVEQKKVDMPPVLINRLTIVLDGIRDPGNLGTIIRIADWFGIAQVIASEDTVELYNPKVIQSTMGSFVRVNEQGCRGGLEEPEGGTDDRRPERAAGGSDAPGWKGGLRVLQHDRAGCSDRSSGLEG